MAETSSQTKGSGDRFTEFLLRHVDRLKDPESMIALFILTLWVVFNGTWGGWLIIVIFLAILWPLHVWSVESGNHVVLWLTTSILLLVIGLVSEATFGGLSPVLLAASGATALAYNELIRLNYNRRRNAIVHQSVYQASAIGLAAASGIAIVGVAVAQIFANGEDRSWLWMPGAVAVLMAVSFAGFIAPTRQANEASKQRWQPGERIPPQPLGKDDLEQF